MCKAHDKQETKEEGASPLLLDLYRQPFAKVPGRFRSVDAFDYGSSNYIGLRMLDGVSDFEANEKGKAAGNKAESVGELLGA